MSNTAVQALKDTIEFQHNLTVWYASLLKDTDVNKHFESNGLKMNSLYWLVAHLAHSENMLLGVALGKKEHQYDWLKKYSFGSNKDLKSEMPYSEVVKVAKEIHIECMKNLDELTDEDLKKDNILGFSFGGGKSFKTIIMHHIRHEGIHAGHLGLLCKLNEIKTV